MAYTTIDKPTLHFNTKLWTGNSTTDRAFTGIGHQPDMLWVKGRNEGTDHEINDAVRGSTNYIRPNITNGEGTEAESVKSFDTDGYTLGNANYWNWTAKTFVGWSWKAGTTTGLSGGTITPSAYSINTTSCFGIYKWTGTNANATIAHGLGVAPKLVIIKRLTDGAGWMVQHDGLTSASYILKMNETAAQSSDAGNFNGTAPDATVFHVGTSNNTNQSTVAHVAYCFADVKGYQKLGTYEGNGNANGSFIYTGFKPAFVMIKNADAIEAWNIWDNRRSASGGNNEVGYCLLPNSAVVEQAHTASTGKQIDIYSNGFKMRGSGTEHNGNNNTHIYLAIAEEPLVASNGIPCTAR